MKPTLGHEIALDSLLSHIFFIIINYLHLVLYLKPFTIWTKFSPYIFVPNIQDTAWIPIPKVKIHFESFECSAFHFANMF